jgi:threonine/homoserine/homoserine lactone efflux protein
VDGEESLRRLYFKGFLLHVTNPKAIFVWISMVSLALPAGAPSSVMAIFIAGCLTIGLLSLNVMALMFSAAPVVKAYRKARRWIEGGMAAFFAFVGVKLLLARV